MKLVLTITTQIVFNSIKELKDYSESESCNLGKEIRTALKYGKPVEFTSTQPDYGTVVKSEIEVIAVLYDILERRGGR